MVVRYVSFKRLVHVLVKYMCMYRGWSELCYSRDRVINHQFKFGEISPVVWDMTSSTRYRPENSRDDHKCFHVRFIDYRQGFARARFRQLVICDMTSSTRVFEGWPQMFFTWGLLITRKTLPGRDFASYLWHDFFDQSVQPMTTNVFHVRFIDYRQDFARARFRQLFVTWLPRPEGSRNDHVQMFFTCCSLITSNTLPGQDFASYLWHDRSSARWFEGWSQGCHSGEDIGRYFASWLSSTTFRSPYERDFATEFMLNKQYMGEVSPVAHEIIFMQ